MSFARVFVEEQVFEIEFLEPLAPSVGQLQRVNMLWAHKAGDVDNGQLKTQQGGKDRLRFDINMDYLFCLAEGDLNLQPFFFGFVEALDFA